MSAALKQKALTPTPFQSAERARLGHEIARAADDAARRVAMETAAQAANSALLAAIQAAEAAEETLEEAKGNTAKHAVDKVLGTAGPPPMSVAQARAAVIRAQDHLDECREARSALKAELDKGSSGLPALLVADAAVAVIRSEVAARGVAMAAKVSAMQRELVSVGSGLEWLASNGAFPTRNGKPADDAIRNTVWRMESSPAQWSATTSPGEPPFAVPSGRLAWAQAFEELKRDPSAPLPDFG